MNETVKNQIKKAVTGAIIGGGIMVSKKLITYGFKTLKENNSFTISISNGPFATDIMMYCAVNNFINKYLVKNASVRNNIITNGYKLPAYICDFITNKKLYNPNSLCVGTYKGFLDKGTMFKITSCTRMVEDIEANKKFEKQYELTIYGLNYKKYKNIINRMYNKIFIIGKEMQDAPKYYMDSHTDIPLVKSFSFIASRHKTEIIKFIDSWLLRKNWYKTHDLKFKTGILLYGQPGTGKSSIIAAIGKKYNANIITVNCKESNQCLANIIDDAYNKLKDKKFVIISLEDIDFVTYNRGYLDENKNMITDNRAKAFTSGLINLIDGLESPENVLFIGTTNHIDRLDPALIRDGRFNLKIELEYFQEDDVKELCRLYNVNSKLILDKIEEFPICPATVEKMIFEELNI